MAFAGGIPGERGQYNGKVTLLVVLSCVVAASGGLIFGYDLGVSGGVTSMDPFLKKFFPNVYRRMKEGIKISNYCKFDSQLLTLFTSSLYLSGLVSSLFASTVTRVFGRKASMLVAGVAVLIGSALGGAASNLYMLVFGRLFLGIGLGFGNQSIPLYISEMALPKHRGAMNIIFDTGVGIGVLIANIINFCTEKIDGGWGWRISLSMAAVPASILTIGAIILPDTPNSLIQKDNNLEKATRVLQRIRGTNDVQRELDDLLKASSISKTTKDPFKKILQRKYRPQLVMAAAIPFFAQMTGINVITFYAPILFRTIGLRESSSLLSAVVIRCFNVGCTFISMFVVDKQGRRVLFMLGGIQMLATQVTIGGFMTALLGDHGGLSKASAYVVLVLICIYISGFGLSWGPLGWLVPSEIYPLEIRSAGQSITVAVSFFFCFLIGQTFLAMLCHMKAGIFFFFGGWVALMTLFIYFFLPETKNIPIEKVEQLWKEHWFWKRFVGDEVDDPVVQNGKPFLFKDGEESARRLILFLNSSESNVADVDKANMVDLMSFLLSYASNVTISSERSSLYNSELVESSVRHLLGELAKLSDSSQVSNYFEHEQTQLPERNGQMSRSFGPNIEMKRGDWICPRCNFMNFARNAKCLECEEARPKRQLTGGEWECPQCDFFNYGRNTVCLRCDCKRPGHISLGNTYSRPGLAYNTGTSSNKADLDRRLAANEEKAQRWFSKVSQLDSTADVSSAIADEDFPEIMPLRRGVNRFVVSTRKSPLERRLANAQYRRNMDNDGIPERDDFQTGEVNKTLDTKVSRSLDEVLGRSSTPSGSNDGSVNSRAENGHPRGTKSNYVPFVPLPADMFAKKPENSEIQEKNLNVMSNDHDSVVSNVVGQMDDVSGSEELQKSLQSRQHSETLMNEKESIDKEVEQAEKSDRWFKKVTELHNVTDLANAIPDEDFPEAMPMRKGENKFVVSRKKDRSLTSPTYKRRAATEQAGNTNYVPFVPFPSDYFAKKDKQQGNGTDSSAKAARETPTSATLEKPSEKLSEVSVADTQPAQNWNPKPSGENSSEPRRDAAYPAQTSGYSNPNSINPQTSNNDSRKQVTDLTGSPSQQSEYQNVRSTWSGKSLEGSAVKEPDPLDMSEEAKAERWFRRVAQIKDISELSQIPDEDFPSIMPMRKGVNRFVVSKRKTPLERRLTSQQYRKNLPVANSDPGKNGTDSS